MTEEWRQEVLGILERIERQLDLLWPVAVIDVSDACASNDVVTFTVETATNA